MVADVGRSHRLSLLAAVLLAAATVFFVWGVFAERSRHHDESKSNPSATSESAGDGETDEEHAREQGQAEGESAEPEAEAEAEYRPFGIGLESTPLVLGAAVASLALAALVVLRRRRTIVVAVLVVAIGFTAVEIVEVVHQADVNESGLLALALLAGLLHVAAALVAARMLVLASRPASPRPAR
jgi:hypothetical protein